MPTYTCLARAGWLGAERKRAIARAVTAAHSDLTGAPAWFAQVLFRDVADGDHFVGGAPLDHEHVFISAQIRTGRSAGLRDALVRRLTADVAAAAGVEAFGVWVYLVELPPAAMVEFGHVLPEPGEEDAWTAALPAAYRDRLRGLGDP
jgi:phenylpyruvate tautomerase PptA (4-oxalocrotonate tautomerase family)